MIMDYEIPEFLSLVWKAAPWIFLGFCLLIAVGGSCWYCLEYVPLLKAIRRTNNKVIPWLASSDFESAALLEKEEDEEKDVPAPPGWILCPEYAIDIDEDDKMESIYLPPGAKRKK